MAVRRQAAVGLAAVSGEACRCAAVVVEAVVLHVESEAGLEAPYAAVNRTLVIYGEASRTDVEVAVEHEAACIPGNGIVGVDAVAVPLDEFGYADVLECNRRLHIGAFVEAEYASEPAVYAPRTSGEEVFGKRPAPVGSDAGVK